MQFKLCLFALTSLATMVAAGHLKGRQADSDCAPGTTVFCCPGGFKESNTAQAVSALQAAGATTAPGTTVCIGATPSFGGEDEDNSCDDEVDVGCCAAASGNSSLGINCVEFEA